MKKISTFLMLIFSRCEKPKNRNSYKEK